ncbi:MAG: GNAT family N-acetyltransferase [Candidatus Woesearchaeota archaeon]|nr:GNAT family N-acetyltransferase [Candidatus Woesearchaeota archaeon]
MINVVDITEKNWGKYKEFLVNSMAELPKDERLGKIDIRRRVMQPYEFEGRARHFVKVLENSKIKGFIIFYRYRTESSPIGMIEYAVIIGDDTGKGYGSELVSRAKDCLRDMGVSEVVIETEPVPRAVSYIAHEDIKGRSYIIKDGQTIFTTGNLKKGFEAIDRRNEFWRRSGFNIIQDLAYCQPNLDSSLAEIYAGQHRVPLDLQIVDINKNSAMSIASRRVREILCALAEMNYDLGKGTNDFVGLQIKSSHSGIDLRADVELNAVPYTEMLRKQEVKSAFSKLELKSRYSD